MGLLDDYDAKVAARAEFLKDKTPMEVLLWIMRAGDVDSRTQADVAIALLPYMHVKKDAIDPSDDKTEG